ncbi:putative defense protein 3 [Clavelina lepadiformis]|uniref:putative defense protein 3 n=1 Tax=Clavelina lepadiformis TaxID=159417 RepID=UPI0040429B4C
MMLVYLVIFITFVGSQTASGYPSGAPASSCNSMMPRHKLNGSSTVFISGQTSTRYSVVTMALNHSVGDVVRVWVEDNQTTGYKGILLQARTPNGHSARGTWRSPPANTKLIACDEGNDTVSHSNTMLKTHNDVYEWVPGKSYGKIQFVATIAASRSVFWVQLKSSTINGASRLLYSNCNLILTMFNFLITAALRY